MDHDDKFRDEVIDWLRSNGLPERAGNIFLGDGYLGNSHPINESAKAFWDNRNKLKWPLSEIAGLLDNERQWITFSDCLERASAWSKQGAIEKRKKFRQAKLIKQQLVKKAQELTALAKELDDCDGYPRDYFARNFGYFDLFPLAARIQNDMAQQWNSKVLPNFKKEIHDETGHYCHLDKCDYGDFGHGFALEFNKLLLNAEFASSLPKFESLILAYAARVTDYPCSIDDEDFNPIDFTPKSAGSPADFVRVFVSELKDYILIDALPHKIKALSFQSIECFCKVLFQYRADTFIARNCIDSDWNPIKDETDKQLKKKRKITVKKSS